MAPARRVGGTDANPTAISAAQLSEWDATGVVEWWGHRDDMPEVPSQAAIVTLPSRGGEGLPKCLLEAAACGRALVATNIPGCREIVRPGENGILVPPRDPEALAHAIKCLVENGAMRDSFGRASRRIVEEEFAVEHVVQQTLALYGSALAEAN